MPDRKQRRLLSPGRPIVYTVPELKVSTPIHTRESVRDDPRKHRQRRAERRAAERRAARQADFSASPEAQAVQGLRRGGPDGTAPAGAEPGSEVRDAPPSQAEN